MSSEAGRERRHRSGPRRRAERGFRNLEPPRQLPAVWARCRQRGTRTATQHGRAFCSKILIGPRIQPSSFVFRHRPRGGNGHVGNGSTSLARASEPSTPSAENAESSSRRVGIACESSRSLRDSARRSPREARAGSLDRDGASSEDETAREAGMRHASRELGVVELDPDEKAHTADVREMAAPIECTET